MQSLHPMQTKSKSGIFKPKIFTTTLYQEPTSIPLALENPHWKKAIEDEYQALMCNSTWELVPNTGDLHVVQCKWVF